MFTFNKNTKFITEITSVPVQNAIAILERDRDRVFSNTTKPGGSVMLVQKSVARNMPLSESSVKQEQREKYFQQERFNINIAEDKIVIYAQNDLGFVRGLFYLSEHYLGIRPFWFFMDQTIEQKKKILVPEGVIAAKSNTVLFRAWYFADATLMSKWSYNENGTAGFDICLETLLRCGGNTIVAGTEEMAETLQESAGKYGVYCTGPQEKPAFAPEAYDDLFCINLQETNQVTMLPTSVEELTGELGQALEAGKDCFWAVKCSNVRPHVYYLDVIHKLWLGELPDDENHAETFANEYFAECEDKEEIAALYVEYPQVMMRQEENGKGIGEMYYTENVRLFCHQILIDKNSPAKGLCKIEEIGALTAQIKEFGEICRQQKEELEKLCVACTVTENGSRQKALLSATIGLHIKLHQTCRRASRVFARGYESLLEGDYEKAFLLFGDSAVWFDKGDALLRGAEYGVWKNFYANDCITDIKHTAYMVRKVMGIARELGDNPKHDSWYQKYCLSAEEQEVKRICVAENHKTDFELYEAMKKRVVR
jgi:hypothetical protein